MIYLNDLTTAIENSINGGNGLDRKQAYDLAQHVLNFFGYDDRIIDNVLEPEDRDAFYMLEDARILFTEREEITLYDGREWRIHYWLFDKDRIAELMELASPMKEQHDVSDFDYDSLPSDAWDRAPRTE